METFENTSNWLNSTSSIRCMVSDWLRYGLLDPRPKIDVVSVRFVEAKLTAALAVKMQLQTAPDTTALISIRPLAVLSLSVQRR